MGAQCDVVVKGNPFYTHKAWKREQISDEDDRTAGNETEHAVSSAGIEKDRRRTGWTGRDSTNANWNQRGHSVLRDRYMMLIIKDRPVTTTVTLILGSRSADNIILQYPV